MHDLLVSSHPGITETRDKSHINCWEVLSCIKYTTKRTLSTAVVDAKKGQSASQMLMTVHPPLVNYDLVYQVVMVSA